MATSNDKIYQKYLKKMKTMNKMVSADEIYRALLNGKNTYLRLSHGESSHFDPSWIKVIEDCIYDLGEIVNNPRQVTKTDSAVVPVELAKKINGESVQHLASHTQYIKDITEQGDVVPSKILSHFNEDTFHTYENRFIATFIRRLVLFIEKRYDFIMKTIPLYRDEIMIMKNTSVINGQQVEIETKIRVKKETDDDVGKAARAYADRIIQMREYITYYYNSPFMRAMRNERDVRKPILQTNIIRKNPKYRHCYEAFLFIEKFDSLGVTYKVAEEYMDFDATMRAEMNYLFFSTYLSLKDKTSFNRVKTNDKIYKPKVLTSLDDEKFVYGPIYKGPFEFVRVDEQYRKYLESKVRNDLPLHPTKQEKEYYADEYALKKEIKNDERELDRLIARKQKEVAKFEKEIAKIIAAREKEEAELERLRQQEIKNEEDRRIEAKRQEIIAAALLRQSELEEELAREKEELERLKTLETMSMPIEESQEEQNIENNKNIIEEPVSESLDVEEIPTQEPEVVEETPEEPTIEPVKEVQNEEQPVLEELSQPEEESVEEPIVNEPVQENASIEEISQEESKPIIEKPKKRGRKPKKEQVSEEIKSEETQESAKEQPQPEEESIEESNKGTEPIEEQPVLDEPVTEISQEEKPKKTRKPRTKKQKVEEPIEKKVPTQEPKVVEEIKEEPVAEEARVEETPNVLDEQPKTDNEVKKTRKPRAKKEKPVQEAKEPKEKKNASVNNQPEILQVIPGKFIVKTYDGYYVSDRKFSIYKKDAKIFYDFNLARQIKARFGGKVVKL